MHQKLLVGILNTACSVIVYVWLHGLFSVCYDQYSLLGVLKPNHLSCTSSFSLRTTILQIGVTEHNVVLILLYDSVHLQVYVTKSFYLS